MTDVWDDPAVGRGIHRQRELLDTRRAAGETIVGWKVGFSRAVQTELGLTGPVVGFLSSAALRPNGARISVRAWTKPAMEPELAIHLATDVDPGATPEAAAGAIGAIGPAIEIVDVDAPAADVEAVVGGDIYQRHVIVGKADTGRFGGDVTGIRVTVRRDGRTIAEAEDPTGTTGPLPAVIAHVASWLGAAGERLLAGQFVICGSTTPLVFVEPGRYVYECSPIDELTVSFVT